MISERKLVASHSSFWRSIMPLGDAFIRAMNVNLERFAKPLPSNNLSSRNALISELAFRVYGRQQDVSLDVNVPVLAAEVREYISTLERGAQCEEMTAPEIEEAQELAQRIQAGVHALGHRTKVTMQPPFLGCGIVADCEGDILLGRTLCEVKNVERGFRLADIRQVLVYCALNFASRQYAIETVALLNARAGVFYRIPLNSLCVASAGVAADILLGDICAYAMTERPSQ